MLEEALTSVVTDIWAAVVKGPISPWTKDGGPEWSVPSLTASVRILGGGAQRRVVARCSPALGREIAGSLLDVDPALTTDADVKDALGEIANILGGNVKGLLSSGSPLSSPRVGKEGAAPAGAVLAEARFTCGSEPLQVEVLSDTEPV